MEEFRALPPQIYPASCTADDDWRMREALRDADAHRVAWVRHDGCLFSRG